MFGLVRGKLLTGLKWIALPVGHCISVSYANWTVQTLRLSRRGRQKSRTSFSRRRFTRQLHRANNRVPGARELNRELDPCYQYSTYVFTNVPHEMSLLRETYATVRSKRYEPSWPQGCGPGRS
ncbi:hypothetical protein ARMGADRAFT_438685 [Armillaria gallica]|uniref:Uncharacterized protein n=1 Tax=Armillaria gallica TaxID=47427 RepID=A0A2H3D2L6_ARMGA|nr:hypothetical protein ARMGADRAFT_438685 [Armillaria gallica]